MKRPLIFLIASALVMSCGVFVMTACQGKGANAARTSAQASPVEYGEYLVMRVSMCQDCHTPKTKDGFDMSKNLEGTVLGFEPKQPVPNWTKSAPAIAGLPANWTKSDMVHYMTTGENPEGEHSKPPMPHYRYNEADAQALTEYLASLGE